MGSEPWEMATRHALVPLPSDEDTGYTTVPMEPLISLETRIELDERGSSSPAIKPILMGELSWPLIQVMTRLRERERMGE